MLTLLWLSLLGQVAPAAEPELHALVVTNNRSLDPTRPDLHYADDDGAQYATLFAEAAGRDRVMLLTRFDPPTARLEPRWAEAAVGPTREGLRLAVDALALRLSAARAAGRSTHLFLVFAGHGDLDRGEGFIELEDGRLRASQLESDVIAKLPADRVHLILDSCNSYFMVSPRKPGGKRWETELSESDSLLSRYPHVGAFLSTSAEEMTYEWSELQSGIFSYEVRSGLRGAADANGDGRISYRELSGFVEVANKPLANALYRPKIFVRPPTGKTAQEALLWTLPQTGRRLEVQGAEARRLTVRDGHGTRVMDVHLEPETKLTLHLPGQQVPLLLSERLMNAQDRVELRHLTLPVDDALTSIDAIPSEGASALASRGEAPVFRSLFEEPFGPRALAALEASRPDEAAAPLPTGVSLRDYRHMEGHLLYLAESERRDRYGAAAVSFVFAGAYGVPPLVNGLWPKDELGQAVRLAYGLVGLAAATAGIVALLVPTPHERLAERFRSFSATTDDQRAEAVLTLEREMYEAARRGRIVRYVGAGLLGALGLGGAIALGVASWGADRSGVLLIPALALGGLSVAGGVMVALVSRTLQEQSWEHYQATSGRKYDAGGVQIAPTLSLVPGGATGGLVVRF